MKRFAVVFLALTLALFALCGCGSKPAGSGREIAENKVAAERIDTNLREFLGVTDDNIDGIAGDRTVSGESENAAADWLVSHFSDSVTYPNLSVTPLNKTPSQDADRTRFFVTYNEVARPSYNVEIRMHGGRNGTGSDFKQVIIGAGYGTVYGDPSATYMRQPAMGAMQSGVPTATLMSIIDYCSEHYDEVVANSEFDLVFVFFGGTYYNSAGSYTYVKYMEPHEKLGTLVMFDIGNLGGDRMYLYADEAETGHEKFLRDTAAERGLAIYNLPSSIPLIDGLYLDDVYYTHFGMIGDHAPFMDSGIPSAALISGYYGGFNLSPLEKKGRANLAGSDKDNYYNLTVLRPEYKTQGSDAASFVISAMQRDGFVSAMKSSREKATDYSFWTNPFWANMIVIFIIIAAAVVLIVLVKLFERKYPYVPQIRRMKVAVFGMDYEDKSEGDIFIDVRRTPKNPFDGY